jgi:hypothetical protein
LNLFKHPLPYPALAGVTNDGARTMRELIHRLLSPFMDYGTRHHFARWVQGTDYKFILAALALVVGTVLVIRYVGTPVEPAPAEASAEDS